VTVITERVLQLRALAESNDVQSARAALRRYLKGGEITLTPDDDTYVARAEFMPLCRASPSQGATISSAGKYVR
jgi:hypothetical protein